MLPILKIYVRHIISVYIEFTVLCSPFGIEWKIRSERRSVFLELYKFRTLDVALICGKMPRLIKSMHGPLLTLSNQRMFILMNGSYKGRIHPYGHSLRKEEVMGWCRQSRSPIISRTRADCYRRQDFIVSVVKSFRMLATVVKLTYASLYAHHSTWCMNNQKDGKSICNKEKLFFLHSPKDVAISLFGSKETLISCLVPLLSLSATSPHSLNFSSALVASTRTLQISSSRFWRLFSNYFC